MIEITLGRDEVKYLREIIGKGRHSARTITRARILLLAHEGKRDYEIANALGIGRSTVWRIKKRYLAEGLQSALSEKYRPGQPRKYTEKHEAEIIALACTTPPKGSKRWSIALLTEELRKKKGLETVNRESVRLVLKKVGRSLG
jgi:transposase